MTRPTTLARIAGLLYLMLTLLGGWAQLYVRDTVRIPGDVAATADNIGEHETLFRLSLAADILMATVFVFLGIALYRLLHHVDTRAATALLVFVAVGAGAILVNLTFQVGALLVATDPAYAASGGIGVSEALASLMLDLHHYGYIISGVFFGLWLLPMGYLAYTSSMFPTTLGVLLIVGCFAWIADPVIAFVLPDIPGVIRQIVSIPTSIAEFGLMLFLLIRGVRSQGRPSGRISAETPAIA